MPRAYCRVGCPAARRAPRASRPATSCGETDASHAAKWQSLALLRKPRRRPAESHWRERDEPTAVQLSLAIHAMASMAHWPVPSACRQTRAHRHGLRVLVASDSSGAMGLGRGARLHRPQMDKFGRGRASAQSALASAPRAGGMHPSASFSCALWLSTWAGTEWHRSRSFTRLARGARVVRWASSARCQLSLRPPMATARAPLPVLDPKT